MNRYVYNGAIFNAPLGSEAAAPVAPGEARAYRIVVKNAAGTILCFLRTWHGGIWAQKINEPGALRFAVPFDDAGAGHLDEGNWVWLYDDQAALVGRFRIVEVEDSRSGVRLERRVSCEGLMAQLADEAIELYEKTEDDGATIGEMIGDWFGEQQASSPILVGKIDAVIREAVRTANSTGFSVLAAIRQVWFSIGGQYWVEPDTRKFRWGPYLDRTSQRIELGKNLRGVTRDENAKNIKTRVFYWGAGQDELSRVSISGKDRDGVQRWPSSHSVDYVAAASEYTDLYGIRSAHYYDDRVKYPDTLYAMALAKLEQLQGPQVTYSIQMADLSFDTRRGLSAALERPVLGAVVTVTDSELGIADRFQIVELTRDLDHPSRVEVVLQNEPALTAGNTIAPVGVPGRFTEMVAGLAADVSELAKRSDVLDTFEMLQRRGDITYDTRTFRVADEPALAALLTPDPGTGAQEIDSFRPGDFAILDDPPGEWRLWNPDSEHWDSPVTVESLGINDPEDIAVWNIDTDTGTLAAMMADILKIAEDELDTVLWWDLAAHEGNLDEALADALGPLGEIGDDIQAINDVNAQGDSTLLAAENHVHEHHARMAFMWPAADSGSASNGALRFSGTTIEGMVNGTWRDLLRII